ncbi:MAG TPA: isoprenylcysteine carboxylmethyltransferase family protein [Pyrinomonadaceae bacterium]|nr:isoprenylcysteine carboxylmethyltransferase family protein [Pyrinomonadaceae bacterium]
MIGIDLRYFLPIYLFVYILAAFVWRSYLVWKRTGINPVTFKGADNAHDFVGRIFKLVFVLIVLVVFVYSFFPDSYTYTAPIQLLEHRWLTSVGVLLLLLSLLWIALAQSQMGAAWRIGIDTEHRTPLVREGVFRLSRNPIFLGMMITLLGLFLIIPNALTLLAFVLGIVLIGVQVRLEEEYLAQVHPEAYREYRQRVRRWL